MDATLPVDLRRFRPVVETSFKKIAIQQYQDQDSSMEVNVEAERDGGPLMAGKVSPSVTAASAQEESMPTVGRTEHHHQMNQQQQPQQQHRSLKFSVENILDPTKFTGHQHHQTSSQLPPRLNNNIFQHPIQHMHHHPLFNHHHPAAGHHPWVLPVNPANLLQHQHHHHQQQHSLLQQQQLQNQIHHHMDVHSTSVESEDSLYDRSSDLESGTLFTYKI